MPVQSIGYWANDVCRLNQPRPLAELSKAVVAIKTPVSGRAVEVNPPLETPELAHRELYGRGRLVRIAPERWNEDL